MGGIAPEDQPAADAAAQAVTEAARANAKAGNEGKKSEGAATQTLTDRQKEVLNTNKLKNQNVIKEHMRTNGGPSAKTAPRPPFYSHGQ